MSTATMSKSVTRPGTASDSKPEFQLMTVIRGANSISVDIPESATLTDIEKTLAVAIHGYQELTEAAERLKPVIGRILLEVRERRLYKPAYRNFTDFMKRRVGAPIKEGGLGMGSTNAFDALKIARAFPSLSTDEYHQIGASRLLLAARVTDEKDPTYKDVLKQAQEAPTVEAFKEIVSDLKGHRRQDKPKPFIVGIRLDAENFERWRAIKDAEPDRDTGDIFTSMMDLYSMRDQLVRRPPAHATTRRRAS